MRHGARWAGLGAALLLTLSACGGNDQPVKLTPTQPDAPTDLCSLVPASVRTGLDVQDTNDQTGNPTAACSIRSAPAEKRVVRGLVTFVNYGDETNATDAFKSQCRSIDPSEFTVQQTYQVQGADLACAGSASTGGGSSASVAAVAGGNVLTARLSSQPHGSTLALEQATTALEGVLAKLSQAGS